MRKINELQGDSRIWIYQSSRVLGEQEEQILTEKMLAFIDVWSSHGQTMDASGEIFHHRFLIIAADEKKATASGCGIDKSVNFVKRMGEELNVDFFNRTLVLFKEKGEMKELPLNVFWAMRKAGNITDSTIVFDNTIQKLAELEKNWEVPFAESWHAQMWGR